MFEIKTKIVMIRYDRLEKTEKKLERLASKGLFLTGGTGNLWKFEKREPRKARYALSFFNEASIYNPEETENQKTYHDYAIEAGWSHVCSMGKLEAFISYDENPVPFETDEASKLEKIHKSISKTIIPSWVLLIIIFGFNLFMNFNRAKIFPSEFFASRTDIGICFMLFCVILSSIYNIISYFLWYNMSKKAISKGGTIIKRRNVVEIIFFILTILGLIYSFYNTGSVLSLMAVMLIYMFALIFIYSKSIGFFRKKKLGARKNMIFSTLILILLALAFNGVLIGFILKSNLSKNFFTEREPVRTFEVKLNGGASSYDFDIYEDDLPLTCEDLYGKIDYANYSYEREEKESIFIKSIVYQQNAPAKKNRPEEIWYKIVHPKFDFVYDIVKNEFLDLKYYFHDTYKKIDARQFNSKEAYQMYDDEYDRFEGRYVLLYENKIIMLEMERALDEEGIKVVVEKLGL